MNLVTVQPTAPPTLRTAKGRPLGTGELLGYPQVSLEDSPPPSPQSVALDGRALVTLSLQSLEVCYKDLLLLFSC